MTRIAVDLAGFGARVTAWGDGRHRELPWRDTTRDPYRVWVAEAMLQQTRAATAAPYYERFIRQFPTVEALAAAPEDDVMKAWEGLGYYRRARLLHAGAKAVTADGGIPQGRARLQGVPGIGPYMSAAIAAIAFDSRDVPVDGNVMRVAARVLDVPWDVAKAATARRIEEALRDAVPDEGGRAFAEALFDLGRTVCTPLAPLCGECPVTGDCLARARGRVHERPVKTRAKPPRPVRVTAAIVTDAEGRILLSRRDAGLLAGMWGLPWVRGDVADLAGAMGISLAGAHDVGVVTHTYSHEKWDMRVIAAQAPASQPADGEWVPRTKVRDRALGGVFQKALTLADVA